MEKKIALITGVSRQEGLGFAAAEALSALDYTVIITARKHTDVETLASRIPNSHAVTMDITDDSSVQSAATAIEAQFGHIDVLINNAALMLAEAPKIEDKDLTTLSQEFDTNVTGTWRVTKYFLPLLRKSKHPRIVNISSTMGSINTPGFGLLDFNRSSIPAYSLTKLALNGLTIKTARDLQDEKILVNAICPGFTATRQGMKEMGARAVEESLQGIIWAATLPDDGPTGQFFRDGDALQW